MKTREKLIDISMLLGTAAAIIVAVFAGFAKDADALKTGTFRLHILANSDSAADQQIKLALRDHLLTELEPLFSGASDKNSAKALAEQNIEFIEDCANEFLAARGVGYSAECSVENDIFPLRVYDDVTLPAGNYDALKIVLGSGEGHNWWCVLYPTVCLRAASAPKSDGTSVFPQRTLYERQKLSNRRTADSLKAERGEIELRFALYDLLSYLFRK